MNNNFPFYYEVRVKLLAFDKDNNVRNESFTRVFKDSTPLENRKNAFDDFNGYMSDLDSLKRLQRDKKGNFVISQPTFISEILHSAEKKENYFESLKEINQFREEISIFLVVTDLDVLNSVVDPPIPSLENLLNKLDQSVFVSERNQNEFEIHKTASYSFEEQDIIDNLEVHELPLYEYYKINVSSQIETVYHFGLDYSESGENKESGAERTILKTPYIWNSLDDYNESINSNSTINKDQVNTNIDFLKIIQIGENNQIEFKPSLLYNFKTQKAGITPKFHIAKTICAFLNSNGGVLFIGVTDKGEIQGLDFDYSLFPDKNSKDKILLELDSLIAYFLGLSIKPFIDSKIETIEGKDVLILVVSESYKPTFLKNKRDDKIEKEMYIRMNASTHLLSDNEELVEYVLNKVWKKP